MGTTDRRYMPSPALAVSILALAVASVGTAGALPGKGKVKANDLAKNAVRAKAIAEGAVKSRAIAAGAVGNGQLADSAVSGRKLGSIQLVTGEVRPLADPTPAGDRQYGMTFVDARCAPPTRLLSGGAWALPEGPSFVAEGRMHLLSSYPINLEFWETQAASDNGSPGGGQIIPYALCLE